MHTISAESTWPIFTLLLSNGNVRQNPYAFPCTMTKKLLLASTILLALAFVVMAADATGKWTYEQQIARGGGDPMTVTTTLDLKVDGSTLTGTVTRAGMGGGGGRGAQPAEIKNGKVDGSNISFTTERAGRGGGEPQVTTYKGKLNGDTLELEITAPNFRGGDPTTTKVTAKRATT